jgi:copper resistance protein C
VTRIVSGVSGGVLLTLVSAVAGAHAHLKAAVPANGSHVASAPASLVLTLSEPARLTVLTIEQEGGAQQQVKALPTQTASTITVALPPLAPGSYHITFRALSADGHVAPGELRFTVDPATK